MFIFNLLAFFNRHLIACNYEPKRINWPQELVFPVPVETFVFKFVLSHVLCEPKDTFILRLKQLNLEVLDFNMQSNIWDSFSVLLS